jgi:CheY-like chemotaxis protein
MRAIRRAESRPQTQGAQQSRRPSRGADSTNAPGSGDAHAHTVLVVDDNRAIRDPLIELLETQGFHARGVGNGREALHALQGGYPACMVLLDLTMPIMDGWAFRAAQRDDARLASIPIVILTALLDPQAEARKLGAVAGFHKPIDVEGLLLAIATHCAADPRRGAGRSRR